MGNQRFASFILLALLMLVLLPPTAAFAAGSDGTPSVTAATASSGDQVPPGTDVDSGAQDPGMPMAAPPGNAAVMPIFIGLLVILAAAAAALVYSLTKKGGGQAGKDREPGEKE